MCFVSLEKVEARAFFEEFHKRAVGFCDFYITLLVANDYFSEVSHRYKITFSLPIFSSSSEVGGVTPLSVKTVETQ